MAGNTIIDPSELCIKQQDIRISKNDIIGGFSSMEKKSTIWNRNFVFIVLSNLLLFFGFEMMATIVPLYISVNGGSDSIVGISTLIFTAAALVTRALSGNWLDRFGRRGVFLCGLAAMMIVTWLYGLTAAVAVILFIRILHGFAWGVASTSSNTIASDEVPKDRFGEGMGYFALSNSLGMAAGPATGLMILNHTGFRRMFDFSAATVILAILLFLLMKGVKTRQDLHAPVQADLSNVKDEGRKAARKGFLEKKAALPAGVIGLVSMTYGALVSFLALYGEQEGIGNIGIYFAVYAIAMLMTRPFAGRITDRRGYGSVVFPGLAVIAVGLVILSASHTLPVFLISAVFYGIGIGGVQAALQAMAVVNSPADRVGAANATFLIGFDGGIGIGSLISGVIAAASGYSVMYFTFILFIAAAGILFFAGQRFQKNQRKPGL